MGSLFIIDHCFNHKEGPHLELNIASIIGDYALITDYCFNHKGIMDHCFNHKDYALIIDHCFNHVKSSLLSSVGDPYCVKSLPKVTFKLVTRKRLINFKNFLRFCFVSLCMLLGNRFCSFFSTRYQSNHHLYRLCLQLEYLNSEARRTIIIG